MMEKEKLYGVLEQEEEEEVELFCFIFIK